jgi:hypothetical protein
MSEYNKDDTPRGSTTTVTHVVITMEDTEKKPQLISLFKERPL